MIFSLPATLAVTLVVLGAMFAGFARPPAARSRPLLGWTLFALGVAALVVAGVAFAQLTWSGDELRAGAIGSAIAACLLGLSARYVRGRDDEDDGDTADPGDDRGLGGYELELPDLSYDWASFDRARAGWDQVPRRSRG